MEPSAASATCPDVTNPLRGLFDKESLAVRVRHRRGGEAPRDACGRPKSRQLEVPVDVTDP
jgi:hypothetical protein